MRRRSRQPPPRPRAVKGATRGSVRSRNDRAAPSDEQGNAHAHGGSGHGQQTETAHVESGHGVTDTGPRTGTGHDVTESFHVESDSGQKTATALAVSDHETSVDADEDRPARSRPLAREREEERERERRRRPRDLALVSFLGSRTEERESREDTAREQEPEDSLAFSRRGTCGEKEGESTDSETREREVCRERATSPPPPPEGKGEEEASPLTPDKCPEALPPFSLDRDRAGGEEAPPDTTPGAPRDPSGFPCPPKGREEEAEEVPGRETPEEVSARGEVC